MAGRESLENLIEGLAGAVVEAQSRIERHQIENFLSFFDEDKRPKKIDILVPSLHPEAGDEDVRYRVPFLPLVASSLLKIKEVEISFDTEIVGLSETDEDQNSPEGSNATDDTGVVTDRVKRSVSLDMRGAGVFRKKSGAVHVVMKVEGRDLSEGMARLIDRLLQVQGEVHVE